jgi:hypothetical protein
MSDTRHESRNSTLADEIEDALRDYENVSLHGASEATVRGALNTLRALAQEAVTELRSVASEIQDTTAATDSPRQSVGNGRNAGGSPAPEAGDSHDDKNSEAAIPVAQQIIADYAEDAERSPALRRGRTVELQLAEAVVDFAMRMMRQAEKRAEESAVLSAERAITREQLEAAPHAAYGTLNGWTGHYVPVQAALDLIGSARSAILPTTITQAMCDAVNRMDGWGGFTAKDLQTIVDALRTADSRTDK